MPTTDNYVYFYTLGTVLPTGATTYPASGVLASNLNDTADGSSDGLTAAGDTLFWDAASANVPLVGFHNGSEPVLFHGTFYYALSDNGFLTGNLGFSDSGTYAYCFAADTAIATPTGEAAVQSLAIGDLIRTATGRDVLVKWVGQQTLKVMFAGDRAQPVRIRANALGPNLPYADLTVTPDHGMILDGLVINASALVNGHSIDFVPLAELPDRITYYHIETEDHDVILANGAPAETFVDIPGRMAFDNYREYLDLYGAERIIPEMNRPRIATPRLLPDAIKARLDIADEVIDFGMLLRA